MKQGDFVVLRMNGSPIYWVAKVVVDVEAGHLSLWVNQAVRYMELLNEQGAKMVVVPDSFFPCEKDMAVHHSAIAQRRTLDPTDDVDSKILSTYEAHMLRVRATQSGISLPPQA